ncbi:MAG TPA: DUF881 domain-containing protein [Jiangellaceae bacterium]|nr:DUF881 domain-containing protein [Jiangellaceae bacterium]
MPRAAEDVRAPDRRPDASMSLLNDIFAHPLDPGYQEAADQRAAREQRDEALPQEAVSVREAVTETRRRRRFSPLLLTGALAIGLLVSLALIDVRDDADAISAERDRLIERVREEERSASELEVQLAEVQQEVLELEAQQLDDVAAGDQLRERSLQRQLAVGSRAVEGPGIVVEVEDAAEATGASGDLGRILDIDLQQLVNGLWAAGAEAVSINGHRVTPLTSIRTAGNVIQINFTNLVPPYEVSAIGDDRVLATTFDEGPGGQWLRASAEQYGVQYSIRNADSLELPGVPVSVRHAEAGGSAT